MKRLSARIVRRQPGETPRQALLRILKLRGEMSTADLCKVMKVTYTAVRRHLSSLQQEGLITARLHQHGVGRPIYKYCLTDIASAHVPAGYENLAAGMLDTVFEQSGHTGVMEFLRSNDERLINLLRPKFAGKTLAQRVEMMATYFVENGYMTKWSALPDGNFFLYQQNCAVIKLAMRYRQLCILEPRLMESLIGVKVSRQQYILKNQPICGYLIDSSRPLG